MAKISGVVYDPPATGFPHIVVLLHNGDVLSARACPSRAAGEAFLIEVMPELQADIDAGKAK